MENKKYKLIKDLPDLPKGAVFRLKKPSGYFEHSRNGGDGKWIYMFDEESILRNPTWWKTKNS